MPTLKVKINSKGKLTVDGGDYPVLSTDRKGGDRKLLLMLPASGTVVYTVVYDGGKVWYLLADGDIKDFDYQETWRYPVPNGTRVGVIT